MNIFAAIERWCGLSGRALIGSIVCVFVANNAFGDAAYYEVHEVTVPYERVFDGVVESVHQSTVSAQTSGRIIEVKFDVNDVVPQGAVILRLDDAEQKMRVEAADAAVRDSAAQLKESTDDLARVNSLVARSLASKADLDRAQAQRQSAQARYDGAIARQSEAKQQLEYTTVKAPYGGVVVERHVQVGEAVQVGTPLMTGFSLETLRVSTTVPQDVATIARENPQVRIIHNGSVFKSGMVTVFPYADPSPHGFRVRVSIPPEFNHGLFPGSFVKVGFVVAQESRLVVPTETLVQRGEITAVYVQEKDQSEPTLRYVRLGRPREGDTVEVVAGLTVGDRVVLERRSAVVRRRAD